MATQYQSSWTKTIDGATIEITEADNVRAFSLKVQSGSVTVLGSAKFQDEDSEPLQLQAGDVYTVVASQYAFLSGYTIDTSGGIIVLDIQK